MQEFNTKYIGNRLEETAGFDMMMGGFQRACHTVGLSKRYLKIGEFVVCLQFAGDGLLPYLGPALEHLYLASQDLYSGIDENSQDSNNKVRPTPDLTICLWDSVSTNTELTLLMAWLLQSIERDPFRMLSPRQEIHTLSN